MDVIRMQLVDYANVIGNVGWREGEGGEGDIRQTLKKGRAGALESGPDRKMTNQPRRSSLAWTITV